MGFEWLWRAFQQALSSAVRDQRSGGERVIESVQHEHASRLGGVRLRAEQKKKHQAPPCDARPGHLEKVAAQKRIRKRVVWQHGSTLPTCNFITLLGAAYPASSGGDLVAKTTGIFSPDGNSWPMPPAVRSVRTCAARSAQAGPPDVGPRSNSLCQGSCVACLQAGSRF